MAAFVISPPSKQLERLLRIVRVTTIFRLWAWIRNLSYQHTSVVVMPNILSTFSRVATSDDPADDSEHSHFKRIFLELIGSVFKAQDNN